MAPSLHMVELRKTGGDTLEFHKASEILTFIVTLFPDKHGKKFTPLAISQLYCFLLQISLVEFIFISLLFSKFISTRKSRNILFQDHCVFSC